MQVTADNPYAYIHQEFRLDFQEVDCVGRVYQVSTDCNPAFNVGFPFLYFAAPLIRPEGNYLTLVVGNLWDGDSCAELNSAAVQMGYQVEDIVSYPWAAAEVALACMDLENLCISLLSKEK